MNPNVNHRSPEFLIRLSGWFRKLDLPLIIILFLVTNQAMIALKVLGIALVFILRPNLRLGLGKGRLPLFYVLAIVLGIINLFVHVRDFSTPYLTALAIASGYWLAALFCTHHLKLSLEKRGFDVVHRSLQLFTVINLLASVSQLIRISTLTGKLNPYTGLDFPYGMSTGDLIFGAFMQLSYCNMMVSTMLCIYFLFRNDLWCALAACASLLLVFGNVGNIIFAAIVICLLILFLLRRILPRIIRQFAPPAGAGKTFLGIAILFAFFYGFVSTDNLAYTTQMILGTPEPARPVAVPVFASEEPASRPDPPAMNVPAEEPLWDDASGLNHFQQLRFDQYEKHPYVPDSHDFRRRLALTHEALSGFFGKKLAFEQTRAYLGVNAKTMLFGAGPVRYSSITAQRMSGLDSSRLFQNVIPRFVAPEFHDNHRLLSIERTKAPEAQFSNKNWPDSFYNQLLGEYGVLGALSFLIFYVGFFLRNWKKFSYSIWIGTACLPFALLTYLFEPLCVIVFLELLLYLDLALWTRKESSHSHA